MKLLREDDGNILVLTALSMVMLLGFLGLAIDVGQMLFTQRQLQSMADAAAMAGALEVSACAGTADCTEMTAAATSALTEGGNASPTLATQCAANSGSGLRLTINNGPCAVGTSDPNNGKISYVEAVVTFQQPTYFETIFGISKATISARAEAGVPPTGGGSGACMLATGSSGQTLTLNGGTIKDGTNGANCGITVDSTANGTCMGGTPAVMIDSVTVTVSSFNVAGNYCNNSGTFGTSASKPAIGATSVADPFATDIAAGTLSTPAKGTTQSVSTVGSKTTLNPGYYQNGLNFNGSGYTVTLNPGVYYFGGGVNVGAVTLSGTGVTIYMASGQLNMNSNSAVVNLTPPTTGSTAGMLIWQPSTNSNEMNLDSGSTSSWTGGIYAPGAEIQFNSNSTIVSNGLIVAKSYDVDSGVSLTMNCSASTVNVTCPGGATNGGSATVSLAE